jgi:membrane protein DedA with SNARE-associated domain
VTREFFVAALLNVPSNVGYPALAALVGSESAGLPVPGETALIAAALLARDGQLALELVIAIAAVAAIVGDNIGYEIGRRGGRPLLEAPGPLFEYRTRILERGEPFFARHGPKAVFLGRWFALLRIAAAWLAGVHRMHRPTFMFWNALGGIAWATSVGVAAYLVGPLAETILRDAGIAGITALAIAAGIAFAWRRRARAR